MVSSLACLMAMISMTFAIRPPLPDMVPSIDKQCFLAGHTGACYDLNAAPCAQVICKRRFPTANGVRTISIGPAARGTTCAMYPNRKVCEDGRCVNLGSRRMPVQLGNFPSQHCMIPNRRSPVRSSSPKANRFSTV